MTRAGLVVAVALVAASAACTPAGRHTYTGAHTAPGQIPPGYRSSIGSFVLMPRTFPFVRCPGRVKAQLEDWGATGYWNRVGRSIAEGVRGHPKTVAVLRSSPEGSFGRAVVCSRRGTDGMLRLTVHLELRAVSASRIFVTLESVAAWNIASVRARRSLVVGRRWLPVTLAARLDPKRPWYALYVVSRGAGPFFIRHAVLGLAA